MSASIVRIAPAHAVDQPVAPEEHAAAGEDADVDRPVGRCRLGGLLDQIECHRADQHAGAEGHDHP
ncbi:MAG TPA: hypothetical protein VMB91_03255, partial [Solirubrobacteraceae bacterium]|nr:hypothetical protein [Solirubrobacteraceae bacterium]